MMNKVEKMIADDIKSCGIPTPFPVKGNQAQLTKPIFSLKTILYFWLGFTSTELPLLTGGKVGKGRKSYSYLYLGSP